MIVPCTQRHLWLLILVLSTFQKLVKGISGDSTDGSGAEGCRNCRGQDSSAAWNTAGILRDENRDLKQRVSQLEVAVEGALDMVNGIGMWRNDMADLYIGSH